MKRRLAVIMVADMVGYSASMSADQNRAVETVQELRDKWLEPEVERRNGEVLKRLGDGWIIAFPAITEAIQTAQTVQTALYGHPSIKLRIAAHIGEIIEADNDLYGTGVNIAARLQSEAPPGGIMITEDLHHQMDEVLTEEFGEAGTFELKNIARPVRAFQWRPATPQTFSADEVPVILIETVSAAPDTPDSNAAAQDLREQLVQSLSRRTGIRVVFPEGGEASKPTYALRGRLRQSETSVRISLSLALLSTGQVVWSDVYRGAAEKTFEIVDFAAARADSALRTTINALDGERLSDLPDDSLSASELRARAAFYYSEATIERYEQAIVLLERALDLVPDNPMSLAMWAYNRVWLLRARFEKGDPSSHTLIATRSDAAVQAAPQSDFAAKVRCEVQLYVYEDIEAARRAAARASRLNPNYALLKLSETEIALAEGDWEAARSITETYFDAHPSDDNKAYMYYARAVAELLDGKYDSAAAWIGEAIAERPTTRAYHLLLAEIHRATGSFFERKAALSAAERSLKRCDPLALRFVLPEHAMWLMNKINPTAPTQPLK